MTWTPLLDGDLARRARSKLDAIAAELARRADAIDDPSLGAGQAGFALLHGYRALDGAPEAADLAVAAIQRSLDHVMANPRPWLFFGYAGTGFVMQQLAEVIGDTEDTLVELDGLIATALATDPWPYAIELMIGVTGLGVYGLERGRRALVERAVSHLDARAERLDHEVAWRRHDPAEVAFPDGYYNLGLAHGQAGSIGFLAAAAATCPQVAPLIRGAVAWLVARERPDHVPRYPMTIGQRTMEFEGILDGWCYGDASVAITLVRAGTALREPAWISAAHALARQAARRTSEELAPLTIDHSLCHGAISQAHVFNRLAQYFDDDELRATAVGWYERALVTPAVETMEPTLQTGLTGLGLGLLAGVSSVAPRWDRAYLLAL